MMTPKYPISEQELAQLWGVSTDTLARIRARGEIRHTRVGGRVRYTESHITEYLHSNESGKRKGRRA